MARVTLGGSIASLNGSIGGTTFQNGISGSIAKNKGVKTKSSSTQSAKAKVALSMINQAWSNMSGSDRQLWDDYAIFKPVPQKNNNSRFLDGHQLFTFYNSAYRLQFDTIQNTPAFLTTPPDFRSPSIVNDGSNLYVRLSSSMDEGTEFLMFRISAPCKASQSRSVGGTKFIWLKFEGSYVYDITKDYTSLYGIIPPVGSYVEVEFQYFRSDCPNWTNRVKLVTTVEVY